MYYGKSLTHPIKSSLFLWERNLELVLSLRVMYISASLLIYMYNPRLICMHGKSGTSLETKITRLTIFFLSYVTSSKSTVEEQRIAVQK